jgi:hemolysin III
MYLVSTLYHALPASSAKRVLRLLDHGAIFLLIAGTYTPITLGVLRGAWGWTLLSLVWGFALLGILLKASRGFRHPRLSMTLYLGMGWLAIIAVRPLWLHMPASGLLWLAAGGVAYTGGVAFFALERLRYAHFAWHLCVLAGTACHFVAVMNYADPVLSQDGKVLYFESSRPLQAAGPEMDWEIWTVDRTVNGWSPQRRLDSPVNTQAMEVYPSITGNGALYFSSSRPVGGSGYGHGGRLYPYRAKTLWLTTRL